MKAIHKILIQNVKDRRKIREEEALEKRNVWTLLDRDYAEMERERIREKKLVYMTHSQTISVPLLEISIDRCKIWPLAGKIRKKV